MIETFQTPGWSVELAAISILLGDETEARRAFEFVTVDDVACLPRNWNWLSNMVHHSEVCAILGDNRRAVTLYRQLLPYAGRNVSKPNSFGAADCQLGLLATTLGHWNDAEAHFEAALRLNEHFRLPSAVAHTERSYGVMLLARRRRGDAARARDLLQRALTRYADLAMPYRVAEVEALLTDRGLPALTSPTYPVGLTMREVEVLRLIAAGRSNREIAEALYLSIRTVERHITNLYAKIDACGKADATAFAIRHGLVLPNS
jgi:DNA-binding NarL/FixJ family response regulator